MHPYFEPLVKVSQFRYTFYLYFTVARTIDSKVKYAFSKKERRNRIIVSEVLPSHIQHIFYFPALKQSTNRIFSFQFFTHFLCVNLTEIGKLSVTKLSVNLV